MTRKNREWYRTFFATLARFHSRLYFAHSWTMWSSRMPASIELSIRLVVCLSVCLSGQCGVSNYRCHGFAHTVADSCIFLRPEGIWSPARIIITARDFFSVWRVQKWAILSERLFNRKVPPWSFQPLTAAKECQRQIAQEELHCVLELPPVEFSKQGWELGSEIHMFPVLLRRVYGASSPKHVMW